MDTRLRSRSLPPAWNEVQLQGTSSRHDILMQCCHCNENTHFLVYPFLDQQRHCVEDDHSTLASSEAMTMSLSSEGYLRHLVI